MDNSASYAMSLGPRNQDRGIFETAIANLSLPDVWQRNDATRDKVKCTFDALNETHKAEILLMKETRRATNQQLGRYFYLSVNSVLRLCGILADHLAASSLPMGIQCESDARGATGANAPKRAKKSQSGTLGSLQEKVLIADSPGQREISKYPVIASKDRASSDIHSFDSVPETLNEFEDAMAGGVCIIKGEKYLSQAIKHVLAVDHHRTPDNHFVIATTQECVESAKLIKTLKSFRPDIDDKVKADNAARFFGFIINAMRGN